MSITATAPQEENPEKGKAKPKSKALILAEDLIVSASDEDYTIDNVVQIKFGKPETGQFFRIHPETRADVRLLKLKHGVKEECYIVSKAMASKLDYVKTFTVFLGAYSDGTNFLWPVGTDSNSWVSSARRIIGRAETEWVRLVSNLAVGNYKERYAPNHIQEPEWNGLDAKPITELLMLALDENNFITDMSHPIAINTAKGE